MAQNCATPAQAGIQCKLGLGNRSMRSDEETFLRMDLWKLLESGGGKIDFK